MELHLLCRDSFGLSYDFTVCTYEIDQDGTMVEEVRPDTDYNVRRFLGKITRLMPLKEPICVISH